MLRGALLGYGHVAAEGHAPGWRARPDVEIVAAADARPGRRTAFFATFPQGRWYTTAEDLLMKEDLDFVDICTPPASHAMLVRQALARSLHVLCEKPLVVSPEELRGLPALSAEKDRAVVTVHNWRFAPAVVKVAEVIASGALGDLRRVRWQTLRSRPAAAVGDAGNWRVDPTQSGGGVLVDHGWHAFYVVSGWMGAAPRTVAARLETRKYHEWPIEDTADLFLVYPSASAEILLTWADPERANRAEITGTKGQLRLDGGQLALFESDGAPLRQEWSVPSLTEGSHHSDWFSGVIEGFLDEVADAKWRGRNLAEATLCANVLALARESSRQGGVPLPVERMPAGASR
jgi:predicted dehydrogenase